MSHESMSQKVGSAVFHGRMENPEIRNPEMEQEPEMEPETERQRG